ncbi:MAG: flippase-like domain-containing protein [Chitinophagales bacterium]|nr:flippase-like domain-containing protein [Chitinophagales bacterium]
MQLPNRKIIWAVTKAVLFVLLVWFLVNTLFLKNDFKEQGAAFSKQLSESNAWLLCFLLLLMPVNWLLETFKWKVLLKEEKLSFADLLKGVLAGVTFGFATPARGGEFIGRVMYAGRENGTKVFYLSAIGGIAQTTVTLVCGVFCLSFLGNSFLQGVALGVSVAFLFFYFRFDVLNRLLLAAQSCFPYKITVPNNVLPSIERQSLVLLLSFFRYGVYLVQYVLAFMFMGVSDDLLLLTTHNGMLLLVQSFSPFLPVFDAGFRGSAALYVFKDFNSNSVAVLSATLLVWFINLVLPALAGYVFIVRKKAT